MTTYQKNLSYRDIKQIVIDRIQNNIWKPDTILPTETELTAEFSSTRTTVNRALRELAEEGYLERKRKSGTRVLNAPIRTAQFAIPQIRDEIISKGLAYKYALIERQILPAPLWLAAKLDLKANSEVLYLRCMHYADNNAYQYEVRWVLVDVVPEILKEDFTTLSPGEWLVKNVPFTNLELSFMATKSDKEIAEFLDANEGDSIFTVERLTWLQSSAVTYAKFYFTPGYKMKTNL